MKTAIVYYSKHHGNTKKLLDAIAATDDVDLIDAVSVPDADLHAYARVGFASGVYFSKYHPSIAEFAKRNLPEGMPVFFLHTGGSPRENQNASIKAITDGKNCPCLGVYFCKGFDTYGPFKLIGGIAKDHPSAEEIAAAVAFYKRLAD